MTRLLVRIFFPWIVLTSYMNGKRIIFRKTEITTIFEVADEVKMINNKDILVKGHTAITLKSGQFYAIKESIDYVMRRI